MSSTRGTVSVLRPRQPHGYARLEEESSSGRSELGRPKVGRATPTAGCVLWAEWATSSGGWRAYESSSLMALRGWAGVGVLTGAGATVLAAGPVQGVEVLGVGVGEGVEVFLGGGDLGVAHPVHHGSEVGAAGEEPGGVGVAEVVDADVEVDAGGFDGGSPDRGCGRCSGRWGCRRGWRTADHRAPGAASVIQSASWSTRSGGSAMVRASLSLG